jgi:hypothetical protein
VIFCCWSERQEQAMKRHMERPLGPARVSTALQEVCPDCGRTLPVYQDDQRLVEGLDTAFMLHRRDKRCRKDCSGARPIFYAPRDLRIMLPGRIYSLDVTLYVGERHLVDGVSLAQITRDLHARGVPIDQRHTCRVFRDFVALTLLDRGDDAALRARLCKRGGIVLMCDGVQFEDRSAVLYIVWDGISGEPLFGERKQYRGEDDLVPLFERVRDMGIPVIGVVTDKEKGLVPAIQRVFPTVPYQFCQTHFLKNCAEPLQADLSALQVSVRRRAEAVRKVDKRLASMAPAVVPSPPGVPEVPVPLVAEEGAEAPASAGAPPDDAHARDNGSSTHDLGRPDPADRPQTVLTEQTLVRQVCEMVRVNSKMSGKAPLDPPELKRHARMEELRAFVEEARKKGARTRRPPASGR